jgi:tRNA(adenine34) deaminase
MALALAHARAAGLRGEVPVGAVLVLCDGRVFGAGNSVIGASDPTAHAEILAIREASTACDNYRLSGSALFSTIEPCIMCMAAAVHARVGRIVFGAGDPRWGGAGSLYELNRDARLNHRPEVVSGVLEEACRSLIQDFFREKRQKAAPTQGQHRNP